MTDFGSQSSPRNALRSIYAACHRIIDNQILRLRAQAPYSGRDATGERMMGQAQNSANHNDFGSGAELLARIDRLSQEFTRLTLSDLSIRIDALRSLAKAGGHHPASVLAGGLSDALARDGRAAIVRPYLDGMRDAMACDRQDKDIASLFLATIGVRLAG